MSDIPSREEFEQYKTLRNKGDYRAAAKVLLPYKDNPKVKKLIGELRDAHNSDKKPSSENEKPSPKPATKSKPKSSWGKRLLVLIAGIIGICGTIYFVYLGWYYITDQKGKGEAFAKELDLWSLCFELYYEDHYVEELSSAFSEGCFQEARSMLARWGDEIDYCWQQTNEGKLERQFINCLVDNDVTISDLYIMTSMSDAREATEEVGSP